MSVDGLDVDVSVLTPAFAPGVAHNVVLDTVIGSTPADSDNGVIDPGGAVGGLGDNTAGVALENTVASGDSDVHGLLVKGGQVGGGSVGLGV